MINKTLSQEDLRLLQKGKENICVSVIVPTHRLSPERRGDKPDVEKALNQAKQLLKYKYAEDDIKPLIRSMDELFGEIDFVHNSEGIGLFISPHIKHLIHFPFPVQGKVTVEDSFEIRDLLYTLNYAVPYHVLMLTEKGGRLFKGRLAEITELKADNWPIKYEDDYIYEKPVRGTAVAGHSNVKPYEKDKSEMEAIRFKNFFQQVDENMNTYLKDAIPLIVLGPEKELAWFENVTRHKKNIIGKVPGSYNYSSSASLSDLAWPVMLEYLQGERRKLVKEFEEKIGNRLGITGIQEIWEIAGEGNVFKLLVEKDFRCPGFTIENDPHLYLRPPRKPHKILADAVDELIERVLDKKGQVFFTDNDLLKDHGRIALITRYE